jgi:hypothetical protein
LNRKAARLTRGEISLSSSSHLPGSVGSIMVKPVTLPPGYGKLATRPLPTGSATTAKMIGVRVCCSSDAVVGVVCERMRSGCRATSSFAAVSTPRRRASPSECKSGCCGPPSTRAPGVLPGTLRRWPVLLDRCRHRPSAHRSATPGQTARRARQPAMPPPRREA